MGLIKFNTVVYHNLWKSLFYRNYSTCTQDRERRVVIVPLPKDFHAKYPLQDEHGATYAFEINDNWRDWMDGIIKKLEDQSKERSSEIDD